MNECFSKELMENQVRINTWKLVLFQKQHCSIERTRLKRWNVYWWCYFCPFLRPPMMHKSKLCDCKKLYLNHTPSSSFYSVKQSRKTTSFRPHSIYPRVNGSAQQPKQPPPSWNKSPPKINYGLKAWLRSNNFSKKQSVSKDTLRPFYNIFSLAGLYVLIERSQNTRQRRQRNQLQVRFQSIDWAEFDR